MLGSADDAAAANRTMLRDTAATHAVLSFKPLFLKGLLKASIGTLAVSERGPIHRTRKRKRETAAMAHQFNQAIDVQLSLGRRQTIADVPQAVKLLMDWSSHRQGAHFYTAFDACVAAQLGRGAVRDAEKAFRMFAEHVGILAYHADCLAA